MSAWPRPWSFTRWGFDKVTQGRPPLLAQKRGEGRVALVTGANSGIGFATASALATGGYTTWLLCRNRGRAEEARARILANAPDARVEVAEVDMSSFDSISRLGSRLSGTNVDVLVHNAGAIYKTYETNEAGLESTFATSVVGPYLLTALLARNLERANGRVIFVASGGAYLAKLDLTKVPTALGYDGVKAYAFAKRGQIVLAEALSADPRFRGIRFCSMHPGWVDTPALVDGMPGFYAITRKALRTPAQGADTIVFLAASDEIATAPNGSFWFDRHVANKHAVPWTREPPGTQEQLIRLCERLSHRAVAAERREG